jgi:hypothetical protein
MIWPGFLLFLKPNFIPCFQIPASLSATPSLASSGIELFQIKNCATQRVDVRRKKLAAHAYAMQFINNDN